MSEQVNYSEMTNKDLQDLIEDFELKISKYTNAKNPAKPNKLELIYTLEKFRYDQALTNGQEAGELPVDPNAVKDTSPEKSLEKKEEKPVEKPVEKEKIVNNALLSNRDRKRLQLADLTRKENVIVTDTQTQQTADFVRTVSWGNDLIGHFQDLVNISGRAKQYVRRGALQNLENVTTRLRVQEDPDKPGRWEEFPRYMVLRVEGLTEDELEKKKQAQAIKLANFVN